MSNFWFSVITIAIVAIVTILIRFFPFIVFSKSGTTPGIVNYLGKVLPYAVMAMLVVFCLKGIDFTSKSHGLPELISVVFVAVLHFWRKNTLLSIIAGTILYMVLIQFVFVI